MDQVQADPKGARLAELWTRYCQSRNQGQTPSARLIDEVVAALWQVVYSRLSTAVFDAGAWNELAWKVCANVWAFASRDPSRVGNLVRLARVAAKNAAVDRGKAALQAPLYLEDVAARIAADGSANADDLGLGQSLAEWDELADQGHGAGSEPVEANSRLREAIAQLSESYRSLLQAVYYQGRELSDLAKERHLNSAQAGLHMIDSAGECSTCRNSVDQLHTRAKRRLKELYVRLGQGAVQ